VEQSRLKAVPLFSGLSRTELKELSRMTDEIMLPRGTRLIDEGTYAHEFLLIISGHAEVRREGELLARLGPGDFAGEIGVMHDARRNASVTASTDLSAIVMTDRHLRQITREMPTVRAQIAAAIEARSARD
jgi:CRP/FNR family cyclic AMP-dependent transcriptional regulator